MLGLVVVPPTQKFQTSNCQVDHQVSENSSQNTTARSAHREDGVATEDTVIRLTSSDDSLMNPWEPTFVRQDDLYNSDADSLFDEPSSASICVPTMTADEFIDGFARLKPANRIAPPIAGLFFDPSVLLQHELAEDIMWQCIRAYFRDGTTNQVMLFERAPTSLASTGAASLNTIPTQTSGLPLFLNDLLSTLSELLRPVLPLPVHSLVFPLPGQAMYARQAIINFYWPGEGITPHVDLLGRYGDGIVGVSLGSGCTMQFARVESSCSSGVTSTVHEELDEYGLYLPRGSMLVLSEDARYAWTHGIEKRVEDLVLEPQVAGDEPRMGLIPRDVRLSITYRWLLPGADVVGGPA